MRYHIMCLLIVMHEKNVHTVHARACALYKVPRTITMLMCMHQAYIPMGGCMCCVHTEQERGLAPAMAGA